jgi:hypothetical protein
MDTNVNILKIYKTEHTKIRIGNDLDGGYVIIDNFDYDLLLSCGISNDTSFENDFLHKYNIRCIAFDGTINNLPINSNKNIEFVKKNISKNENNNTTNLLNIIKNYDNIFLKMDIETWEYEWLLLLKNEHLQKIKQIVIEFHFPFTYSKNIFDTFSYPLPVEDKLSCLKKISDTHYLVHLHPNNCCGTTTINNIIVPNVFECTYIRKDLCQNISDNDMPIPDIILDKPNILNNSEIKLSGYPYNIL